MIFFVIETTSMEKSPLKYGFNKAHKYKLIGFQIFV